MKSVNSPELYYNVKHNSDERVNFTPANSRSCKDQLFKKMIAVYHYKHHKKHTITLSVSQMLLRIVRGVA